MKILYVITGLGGGGAEKVVVDLADQMLLQGHQVKIAYLKGDVVVHPKSISIELIYLGLENVISAVTTYKNYKNLLISFQPDIVHAHMVHANIFVRISRIFYAVKKLICSAHSNNEGGCLRMLAYKFTHKLSDLTTNVSQNASINFEKLGAVPLGGIHTIYNGVDLKKFEKISANNKLRHELGLNETIPVFIAVGRFHEAKDYPNLLNAFFLLKSTSFFKLKQPKLIIIGDGELRDYLEKIILNLSLSDDVYLLGRREDIPELLNMSNFFVLSSKYEGLPTVIIEAMACEKYVITTDCGGSSEIVGDTGILVPIQNSVALAQALENVLRLDDKVIEANNQKARRRVENTFSLEKSVNKWLEIYESK